MAVKNLNNTTVTIGDLKVQAYSTNAGIGSLPTEHTAMPSIGTLAASVAFQVDIHDETAAPFATVRELFDLCNRPTRDKIKPVKIEFWKDENKQDVILSMSFQGWITSWHVSSGQGNNHILAVTLQPALDPHNFIKIDIGN